MTSPFSLMTDTIFGSALGQDARFLPVDGPTVTPVRVVWRHADEHAALFTVGNSLPARLLEVRISEVPRVVTGDQFVIADTAYTVAKVKKDRDGLVYHCEIQ